MKMTEEQFAIFDAINVDDYTYFSRMYDYHINAPTLSPKKAIGELEELILDCEDAAARARSAIAKLKGNA